MINLIRKNGQTNVTAFQDVVLFDYALGGQSGVLKNVGNELALEAVTARQVRVKDGMASIQGYQWEIESGSYETIELNTPPTGSTVVYYYLFAQIDLRDATNQKMTLVLQTAAAAFTNFPAGEDLKVNPSGVAMLPLYTFEQTASSVRNIIGKFKILNAGIVPRAENSDFSENSAIALNSQAVNGNKIVKDSNEILKIGTLIIPQKRLLWTGDININASNSTDFTVIFNQEKLMNKTLEIEHSVYGKYAREKTKVKICSNDSFSILAGGYYSSGIICYLRMIYSSSNDFKMLAATSASSFQSWNCSVYSVYEIIE